MTNQQLQQLAQRNQTRKAFVNAAPGPDTHAQTVSHLASANQDVDALQQEAARLAEFVKERQRWLLEVQQALGDKVRELAGCRAELRDCRHTVSRLYRKLDNARAILDLLDLTSFTPEERELIADVMKH